MKHDHPLLCSVLECSKVAAAAALVAYEILFVVALVTFVIFEVI